MSLVYVNGAWYPKEKACISVYDHGFLYGDGVFETLRAYEGRIFKLTEHLERLFSSAAAINLTICKSKEQITQALYLTLAKNNLKNAYIRLTISRGTGEIGLDPALCQKPTMVIMAHEFSGYSAQMYQQGVRAIVASIRRLPVCALDPKIKSLNFLNNILAKQEAKRREAFEAILLNEQGVLCEATVSNLFFVSRRVLKTPHLECGLLPGITRQVVFELAGKVEGLGVEEGFYRPQALYEADEAFLTNTSLEIMPLVEVDGRSIGDGRPGRITQTLHELFKAKIKEAT